MQLNDAILLTTGGPTVADGLATYYGKGDNETLNDAEYRFLLAAGAPAGTLNDMWYSFLVASGYTGSLNDMLLQYWIDGGGGGGWGAYNFIAAYKGADGTQNINTDGDILNLMPKGTPVATSVHNAEILAPDHEGVYHSYPVDAPVWKGGRVDAGVTYSTDINGIGLVPAPLLQANEAATNLLMWSEDLTQATWSVRNGLVVDSIAQVTLADSSSSGIDQAINIPGGTALKTLTFSVLLWVDSGTEQIRLKNTQGGVADNFSDNITITTTPTRYYYAVTNIDNPGSGSMITGVINSTTAGIKTINMQYMMYVEGEGSAVYISTTTAAASIPALDYTFPAINIDPASCNLLFNLEVDGTDAPVLSGPIDLSTSGGSLVLKDGTNTVSTPVTECVHGVTIRLTGTEMSLAIDTNDPVVGPYVPPAAADLVVHKNVWDMREVDVI